MTTDFLGYTISKNGITPGDHHILAIQKYHRPLDVMTAQRFLGFVSYFRIFNLKFRDFAAPLFEITKTQKCEWRKEQEPYLRRKYFKIF